MTIFKNETSNKEEILESYVSARLKSKYEIFKEKKYEKNNNEFLCYENFIDAYLGGAIGTNGIGKNSNAPTSTHDCNYFKDKETQFQELFANYVELRKMLSPKREEYISKLKEKTSPELLEALEKYYLSLSMIKVNNFKKGF